MNDMVSQALRRIAALVVSVLLLVAGLAAQARDERKAAVGMRMAIEQLVLPGSEVVTAPTTLKAPVALRIVKVWPHGTQFRYDLEWTGLEAGTFDLAKFLVRKDGSPANDLPPIPVEVSSALPAGMVEPSELQPKPADSLGGYRTLQIVAGIVWVVGLLAILLVGRRWRRPKQAVVVVPTLADRLRPLVEAVAAGKSDTSAQAELERLLVAFWRARLGLGEAKAVDAIMTIRRHDEAGGLLRQLEAWLHMPEPPRDVDWAKLLQPYRGVTADSFAPIAAPAAVAVAKPASTAKEAR